MYLLKRFEWFLKRYNWLGWGFSSNCQDWGHYLKIFLPNKGRPSAEKIWSDTTIDAQYNGFYSASKEAMKTGYIRPRYPGFHEVELKIGQVLQELWDGNASIPEAVKELGI